jgi:Zn-dependent M16 (insulinase) family peptidase
MPDQALTTTIPATPEVLSLRVPDSPLVAQAKALQIKTDDDVITAKDYRKQLKAREQFIMDDPTGPQFTINIKNAHTLHKSLVAASRVFTDPINQAIGLIDIGIGKFDQEKRRLKELAEQQAREEQEKDRQKIMNAAQAKIDRALAMAGKTEQQIIDMQAIADNPESSETEITLALRKIEILRLQLENKQEQAAAIQKTAEQSMDALPVASAETAGLSKIAGVKTKKIAEVVDKMALIKLVSEGKAPDIIFDLNQGALNKLVNMGISFPADIVKVKEESKYGGRG